ncbi:MAG: DUF1320 family protein [Thiomargarita sp.]|nr:DUF1320 family protein [Thiomargarita sp.]
MIVLRKDSEGRLRISTFGLRRVLITTLPAGVALTGKYITLSNIIQYFGAKEILERVDRTISHIIPIDLFIVCAEGKDLSNYTSSTSETEAAYAACNLLLMYVLAAESLVTATLEGTYNTEPTDVSNNNVPPIIQNIVYDIARFNLYNSGILAKDNIIERRYEDAMSLLTQISQKKLFLNLALHENVMIVDTPSVMVF